MTNLMVVKMIEHLRPEQVSAIPSIAPPGVMPLLLSEIHHYALNQADRYHHG
jgi:hypothetical protein